MEKIGDKSIEKRLMIEFIQSETRINNTDSLSWPVATPFLSG